MRSVVHAPDGRTIRRLALAVAVLVLVLGALAILLGRTGPTPAEPATIRVGDDPTAVVHGPGGLWVANQLSLIHI